MARIRDVAVTIASTTTTSLVCNMPTHVTGDVLLAICSKSLTGAYSAVTGWSIAVQGAAGASYGTIFAKRAASAAETFTAAVGTASAHAITIISVEGVFGTASNASDAFAATGTAAAADTTIPYTAGSITPTADNSLVISFLTGGATYSIHPSAGWPIITTTDSGSNSSSICYTQQKTAGAITGPTWTAGTGAAASTVTFMIAVRDGSAGALCDAYLDRSVVPSYLLSRLVGSTTDINVTTYRTAAQSVLSSVLVNGSTSKTVTNVSWGTAVTDAAYNPYGTVALQPGASSTTNFSASEIQCTWNLTQGKGLLFGIYRPALPRDYVDLGTVSTGGVAINLTQGTTANARAWVIGGQFDKTTKTADYNPFVIQVQQSTNTAYAWNSTVNWASVAEVGFMTQGYYGAAAMHWNSFHVLNYAVLAGGTPTNPFDIDDLTNVVNNGSGNIPVVSKAGSAITSMIPIQFGGGDPCAVSINLGSIAFPTSAATNSKFRNFHVDPDYFGIEFYGKTSADLFKFTNTVFNCDTSYYWRFNASHSASAVMDFSGSTVINANVTLRSTVTLGTVSFIGCGTIAAAGATFNGTTFSATRASTGAITITSSNNTFATAQSELQAALTKFTSCKFTNNTTGPALVISYTGTGTGTFSLDLTNATFSGNTVDVRWEAPANCNLVINKLGTTNALTSSATNSNTVDFQVSATLQLTGLITGSDIVILNAGTTTERANIDAHPTNTYNFGYTATGDVDICIYKQGYIPYTQRTYTLLAGGGILPIKQVLDRAFSNPL